MILKNSEKRGENKKMGNCGIWKSVGEGGPYADRMVWETLTGNCTARELWKDVRFKWREDGEGSIMAKTRLNVLQMDEKKLSYPVPVIVEK